MTRLYLRRGLIGFSTANNITKWHVIKGIQHSGTERRSLLHSAWSNLVNSPFGFVHQVWPASCNKLLRTAPSCSIPNIRNGDSSYRRVLCLQTSTALPQLCNISWVSAETSCYWAQCIFALLCTTKNIISK